MSDNAAWQKLADDLATSPDLNALDFEQGKLVIDVLAHMVHADGKVAFLEKSEMEHLIAEMPWAEGKTHEVDTWLDETAERLKHQSASDSLKEVAETLAKAVNAEGARRKVYHMAATLAVADFELDDSEKALLDTLGDALSISADDRSAIHEEVGL